MKKVIALALVALVGCAPFAENQTVVVEAPFSEGAFLREARAAGGADLASSSLIVSLAHVFAACDGAGARPALEVVLANANVTDSPEWALVSAACSRIWIDLSLVLEFKGWSPIPEPPVTETISWSDFAYLGACKLPPGGPVTRGYDFLQDADIAYVGNGQIAVNGKGGVVRITLPEMVDSKNPAALNTAVEDPTLGLLNGGNSLKLLTTIRTNYTFGSFCAVPEADGTWTMWTGSYEYYNTAGRDHTSIVALVDFFATGFANPDARGAWALGPFGAQWARVDVPVPNQGWYDPANLKKFDENKTTINNKGGAMCYVPPEIMYKWTGRYVRGVITGGHRGNGAFGGGQGPCMYLFEADYGATVDLNGTPLAIFFFGAKDWPNYKADDTFETVLIWTKDGRSCLLTGGTKGTGAQWYGTGTACDPDKGYHAPPYEPRVWIWDAADFGEVAAGRMDPWMVRPIEEAVPQGMWLHDGAPVECRWPWFEAVTYDWDNEILYALQAKAYDPSGGSANRMGSILHAWGLNAWDPSFTDER